MIILCDIDNCISDDLWRHSLIDWAQPQGRDRYHSYHAASWRDKARNLSILRYPHAAIFFLTAMPEEYRKLREGWLAWHGIHYERMLMRTGDHHLDSIALKRNMVRQLRSEGIPMGDVVAAYDDRRAVVDMYIAERLPGIHLQIHEQEHLHRII